MKEQNATLNNALWLLGLVVAFPLALIVISYGVKTVPGLLGLEYAQTFADNAQIFADATKTTLLLTVTSGILGIILGTVTGIAKLSGFPPFRWIASFYVWVFRGTPLIVQILFAFNATPILFPSVVDVPDFDFYAPMVALALNQGAYNAEVIRASIQAIPRGQTEAARSLGLSGVQAMWLVILPQAVRVSIPPLVNNIVSLLKDTSLATVVGTLELANAIDRFKSQTFLVIPSYLTSASIYLFLTTIMTFFTNELERRFKTKSR
ncbi:amino acid ABC transporter permease [Deinococcus cellulosilyticus]|uniref:Amino acid ABC transporter permease n=1 Tax=Deinococcus cellulosilyticus (strain DSM 18568 / NBRC 106333 / KACC 11606 / 5516J-15) TaxID=1223518 RepID=A0A511NAZ2_DEIC1|nr:amino acid ABC transporter permease [Deinococcus cellulosilyticus]GEM49716.1 amino acid ABC transporter permease [Deinococcus cellulosilyticus NBRC 106333 = KACC 11606]